MESSGVAAAVEVTMAGASLRLNGMTNDLRTIRGVSSTQVAADREAVGAHRPECAENELVSLAKKRERARSWG
jgi:hypothetical protein